MLCLLIEESYNGVYLVPVFFFFSYNYFIIHNERANFLKFNLFNLVNNFLHSIRYIFLFILFNFYFL